MKPSELPKPLPFAHPADLVRAHQKDEQCRGQLRKHLWLSLEELLGHRRAAPLQGVASAVSDFAYDLATSVLSGRSLGEEYCELLPVVGDGLARPGRSRRLLAAGLFILPGLALQSLVAGAWRHSKRIAEVASIALRLHLAMFYLFGRYRHASDRFVGLRTVTLSERPYRNFSYRPLGALLLVQLAGQGLAAVLQRRRAASADADLASTSEAVALMSGRKNVASLGVEPQGARQPNCNICMCPAEVATAPPCGHIFCWDCIASWCAIKASCPLCRAASPPQQLLPLRHYEVPNRTG